MNKLRKLNLFSSFSCTNTKSSSFTLYTTHKKGFFINYLIKNNIVDIVEEDDTLSSSLNQMTPKTENYKDIDHNIDLKKLLDEKNVKLNFKDLFFDYRMYRRHFYSLKVEENFIEDGRVVQTPINPRHILNHLDKKDEKQNLTFDETNASFSKVFKLMFLRNPNSSATYFTFYGFLSLIAAYYLYYKYFQFLRINKYFSKNYKENIIKQGKKNDDIAKGKSVSLIRENN